MLEGLVNEFGTVILSLVIFMAINRNKLSYLVVIAPIMLLVEIMGLYTGLVSYDQNYFSVYVLGAPLVMPFAWFNFIGLSALINGHEKEEIVRYVKVFITGIALSLILEFPQVQLGVWSNNFGGLHIIPGYPLILPLFYGFYVLLFDVMHTRLAPELEKITNSYGVRLAFSVIYVVIMLFVSFVVNGIVQ